MSLFPCDESLTNHADSIDVELPTIVDDEFWEHKDPSLAFKQPADRPSTVDYFNCALKLTVILAVTLRTIVRVSIFSF